MYMIAHIIQQHTTEDAKSRWGSLFWEAEDGIDVCQI
jgi:hypothetical protein